MKLPKFVNNHRLSGLGQRELLAQQDGCLRLRKPSLVQAEPWEGLDELDLTSAWVVSELAQMEF